jgi:endonuclease/exonuclease/phosphatase family metal-dependent hydrolase
MKAKSKLPLFDKFILCLNGLICLALLISYLAPFVDPQKVWFIPFFGLAYPMLLMATLIMLVYWLLRKRWLIALIPVLCIACGWSVLNKNIGFRKKAFDSPKVNDTNVIRVMTYNVHSFKRYGAKHDTSTKHEILEMIKEQKPDIISFQEYFSRKKGPYDMQDSIIKIMGINYYFQPLIYNSMEAMGMAVFSKYPVTGHGMINISDKVTENQCIYFDIKKGKQQFRVYNMHLQSIGFDPEDYKYLNQISQQGKTDMTSTRRLGGKLKSAFIKRSEQVATIKKDMAQCPYPFIICGDFNDTPSSFSVNQMAKGLKNAFCEKGYGFGRTYNGDFPNYQIDYIMTSPQFEITNYYIIEKKLSDHYPVRSDLILNH